MSLSYGEELALIDALSRSNAERSGVYRKHAELFAQSSLPSAHLLALLRLGFREQIFCNPWPLTIADIAKKFHDGEFTNALLRELDKSSLVISKELRSALREDLRKRPSPFPNDIFLRTTTQDFTSNFFYALRKSDGKIFIKPNPRKGNVADIIKSGVIETYVEGTKIGNRTEWNLLNGDGGPPFKDIGQKIVQMSVASEIVVALDNRGQFHIFKPTEYKLPTKWCTGLGCPIPENLYIPRDRKTWTFSSSLKVKPEDRRSIEFMHPDDIVTFYQDAAGREIEFGFTATIYVLSDDGKTVYYWDTGLPGNFGRAFTTPHRGNFVVDNMSAAGSTIMVIGRNADQKKEIYTRMFDYEINGACPGEFHTYWAFVGPFPNRILGLLEARRQLPLPGWRKMAGIELHGNDFISNAISIEVTSQGNSARLLKVAGTKNGAHGFYQKMIDDDEWSFVETPNSFAKNDKNYTQPNLVRNDMDYEAKIVNFGARTSPPVITRIALKNFHYYLGADEPATIEVTGPREKKLSLNFHTNDAWRITTSKKRREKLIGNKDGEPKPLVGTIIIPDSDLCSDDTDIKKLVALFEPFHMKMNAFDVLASDERVVLKSIEKFIDLDDNFVTKQLPPVTIVLNREEPRAGYYKSLVTHDRYALHDERNLDHAVNINQKLLRLLEADQRNFASETKKNWLLSSTTNLGFQVWKDRFSFIDRSVTHSLRKFLHYSDLSGYFPVDNTNTAINEAKRIVLERIEFYERIQGESARR